MICVPTLLSAVCVLRRVALQREPLQHLLSCPRILGTPPLRNLHASAVLSRFKPVPSTEGKKDKEKAPDSKALVPFEDFFDRASEDARTKATFQKVVEVFCKRDIRRRGHVEFIYMALKKMPEFGVEKDIAVYNKILDVFPKEIFVARNFIQRMFNHYPRQQECAIELLEQMESYGIMPNNQTKFLLLQIFGIKSHPIRKYQRMMYWFPKFKHVNPYPVPDPLPQDPVDLARHALQRIAANFDARVVVYQLPMTELTEAGKESDYPYIVGIQSPEQRSSLAQHNPDRPVFVEGPFRLWLKKTCVYYYVLRAELLPPELRKEEAIDPERNFYYPMVLDLDLGRDRLDDMEFDTDEVEEGPVFAMCMAGAGDQVTLAKWILGLQETNPILSQTPVVFRLSPGPRELQPITGSDDDGEEEVFENQHWKHEL